MGFFLDDLLRCIGVILVFYSNGGKGDLRERIKEAHEERRWSEVFIGLFAVVACGGLIWAIVRLLKYFSN